MIEKIIQVSPNAKATITSTDTSQSNVMSQYLVTNTKSTFGNISNPVDRQNVVNQSKDILSDQMFGGKKYSELSSEEKKIVDLKSGSTNADQMFSQSKEEWGKENNNDIQNVPTTSAAGTDENERPQYEYGQGTLKPINDERDKQTVIATTTNKSGIYINEETSNDPNCMYIVHKGKICAIRLSDNGMHFSTDQNMFVRCGVNRDVVVDGSSSIVINGGDLDIYTSGNVNISAKGNINLTSEQSINIRAEQKINLQSGNDTTIYAKGSLFLISLGKAILQAAAWLRMRAGGFINFFSGESVSITANDKTSITASSVVAMDAAQIQFNGGQSTAADANTLTPSETQVASPKKRAVCKI